MLYTCCLQGLKHTYTFQVYNGILRSTPFTVHLRRYGKVLSEAHMLRDILLMKRHSLNAVRCSHYPNHVRWWVPGRPILQPRRVRVG